MLFDKKILIELSGWYMYYVNRYGGRKGFGMWLKDFQKNHLSKWPNKCLRCEDLDSHLMFLEVCPGAKGCKLWQI